MRSQRDQTGCRRSSKHSDFVAQTECRKSKRWRTGAESEERSGKNVETSAATAVQATHTSIWRPDRSSGNSTSTDGNRENKRRRKNHVESWNPGRREGGTRLLARATSGRFESPTGTRSNGVTSRQALNYVRSHFSL